MKLGLMKEECKNWWVGGKKILKFIVGKFKKNEKLYLLKKNVQVKIENNN